MDNILLALSKHRISHEIQRHLREDNRGGIILGESGNVTLQDICLLVIDDLQPEKNKNIIGALNENNARYEIIVVTYAKDREYIVELSRHCNVFRILPANWTPLSIRYAIYYALLRSKMRKVAHELEAFNKSKTIELKTLKEQLDQRSQVASDAPDESTVDIDGVNSKIQLAQKELEILFQKFHQSGESTKEDLFYDFISKELKRPMHKIMELSGRLLKWLENNDPRIYDIVAMMKKAEEFLAVLDALKNALVIPSEAVIPSENVIPSEARDLPRHSEGALRIRSGQAARPKDSQRRR